MVDKKGPQLNSQGDLTSVRGLGVSTAVERKSPKQRRILS